MSSSPLAVHPHLPPTSNILNSQQRTRLVRSTRKLGAVLGTTPSLLENDTSYTILPFGKATPRALKRHGSIFTHQYSSSLSVASTSTSTTTASSSHRPSPSVPTISALPFNGAPGMERTESYPSVPPGLSSSRKCRLGDKPPKLYLRLDTVSISPTDSRFTPSLSPSACSAPPTPITPTVPDEAEIRRKRMAKLARHLGEKIPAELVLTLEPNLKPVSTLLDRPPRQRSQSVQIHSRPIHTSSNKLSPQDWVGEWNRSNIRDVQRELRNLRLR